MIKIFCISILLSIITLFNINAQWTRTNGPEGGIVFSLERVGSEIWAGTYFGGLYTSKDDGLHWEQSKDFPINAIVTNIISDNDTTIVLASYNYFNTNLNQEEIVDSLYIRVNATSPWQVNQIGNFKQYIGSHKIFFNKFGLFLDLNYSNDLGKTWKSITIPDSVRSNPDDIQLINGIDRIILDTYKNDSTEQNLNYCSFDGGSSWLLMNKFPKDHNILEVFADHDLIILREDYTDSIFLSKDFGNQWDHFKIRDSFYLSTFVSSIRREEDGNLYTFCTNWLHDNLWKSIDNGYTWQMAQYGGTDIVPLKNGDYLVSGNGIQHVSSDLQKWDLSNNNLLATDCRYLFTSPDGYIYTMDGDPTFIKGSRLFQSKNGGLNWQKVLPDSLTDSLFIYDMLFLGDTIIAVDRSKLLFSFDKGLSWIQKSLPNYNLDSQQGLLWFKNKLFVGADQIYITSDLGQTWEISNPIPGNYCTDLLVIDSVIFAIFQTGQIFKSTDNGYNWNYLDAIDASYINKLQFLNGVLFAYGYGIAKFSIDRGNHWELLGRNGIPRTPNKTARDTFLILSLTNFGNLLIAAVSDNGVYTSGNLGSNWFKYNDGLENLQSNCVAVSDSILYVGTSDSGIWKRGNLLNVIAGYVWNDDNGNGIKDSSELPYKGAIISTFPLKSYSSSSALGTYSIIADKFHDTLRAFSTTPYTITVPSYYAVSSGGSYNFGVQRIPNITDVSVTITNTAVFRPGFDNSFVITIKNIGTISTDGIVKMAIPYGIIPSSSIPIPDDQTADTITWNLTNLGIQESISITVNFTVSVDLKRNDTVLFAAKVLSINDQDPSNNLDKHTALVVTSYDPNDKSVSPESYLTPIELQSGMALEYTIRFQNTGNFSADFIHVIDTLDESLDLSTFKLISTSHPCQWNIEGKTVVDFYFQNINLPTIEPGSHGFVKFSVSPFKSTSIGTKIPNRAYIYFDYNPSVLTNTVQTKIAFPVNINQLDKTELLKLYPNPTKNHLTLVWKEALNGLARIWLYDLNGKLCFTKTFSILDGKGEIKFSGLAPGNYQLKLEQNNKIRTEFLTIAR